MGVFAGSVRAAKRDHAIRSRPFSFVSKDANRRYVDAFDVIYSVSIVAVNIDAIVPAHRICPMRCHAGLASGKLELHYAASYTVRVMPGMRCAATRYGPDFGSGPQLLRVLTGFDRQCDSITRFY